MDPYAPPRRRLPRLHRPAILTRPQEEWQTRAEQKAAAAETATTDKPKTAPRPPQKDKIRLAPTNVGGGGNELEKLAIVLFVAAVVSALGGYLVYRFPFLQPVADLLGAIRSWAVAWLGSAGQ